jgi:tRNA pseudouridine38-40 synthase
MLETALSTVLGEQISATGAGRTDSGVHALNFCAHVDSSDPGLAGNMQLIRRLNGFLPEDISVRLIRKVVPDAHARFSAISRTYKYYISRFKDPFSTDTSWYVYGNLDVAAMNRACSILMKHSDFTSFSRLHSDTRTNNCRIFEAGWEETGENLVFTIKADRFLRNMVRAIVGTQMDVGFGKMTVSDFEKIILSKDRGMAGTSAPARGLFLSSIEYPGSVFLADTNKT